MDFRYALAVDSRETAERWKGMLEMGGLFVSEGSPPPVFSKVIVALTVESTSWELQGTVVNLHSSGNGFYVQVTGAVPDALESALERAMGAEIALDEGDGEPSDESERERPVPVWDLIDPTSSEPIHSQVRKLSLAEKLKVARTATRPVRELLIRDSEKRIHAEVMKNPKLTDEEVVQYTSMPNLSPRVLEWVSTQTRFMRRRAVLLNIVQNPMTPPDTAKKLLSRLQDHELLRISRSSKIREVVSRAARKMLMKKGVL